MPLTQEIQIEAGDSRPCPACGGANPVAAVFCGHPGCHKALGELRYSEEEVTARSSALERLADHVNTFVSTPHFISLHVLWFALWVAVNGGLIMGAQVFDAYPFGLLGIILSIEAILITGFLLIASQRQSRRAEIRSELDYETNVRAYRKLCELEVRIEQLMQRLDPIGN